MKISQILNSIIIGIAAGSQPIFGYNYGARKFDRVKSGQARKNPRLFFQPYKKLTLRRRTL